MWFIGVELEQETSTPPPKKILDPPLGYGFCSHMAENGDDGAVSVTKRSCAAPISKFRVCTNSYPFPS